MRMIDGPRMLPTLFFVGHVSQQYLLVCPSCLVRDGTQPSSGTGTGRCLILSYNLFSICSQPTPPYPLLLDIVDLKKSTANSKGKKGRVNFPGCCILSSRPRLKSLRL